MGITDEVYPFWMADTQKEKIKQILVRVPPKGRILDVACGPGFLEKLVIGEVRKKLVAVDINSEYIDNVKRDFPEVTALVGDANELKFPNGSFDVIYAIDIIHLLDSEKFFSGVMNVLDSRGKLVVTVFCNEHNLQEKDEWLKSIVKGFSIEEEFVVKSENEWDFCLVLTLP